MRKSLMKISAFLCVFSLLFSLHLLPASGAGAGKPLKLKATDIQAMNYMQLTNRGNMPPQFQDTGYNKYTTIIALQGKKRAVGVGSNDDVWDFLLDVDAMEVIYKTGGEPFITVEVNPTTEELVTGRERGVLLYWTGDPDDEDPEEQARQKQGKKQDSLDKIKRASDMSKDEFEKERDDLKVPFPETVYMADFSIVAHGMSGPGTQGGYINVGGQYGGSEAPDPQYYGKITYNVQLTVDDMGYAKAVINFTDCNGYPRMWTLEGFIGTSKNKPPKKPEPKKEDPDDDLAPLTNPDGSLVTPNDSKKPPGWDDDLAPLT